MKQILLFYYAFCYMKLILLLSAPASVHASSRLGGNHEVISIVYISTVIASSCLGGNHEAKSILWLTGYRAKTDRPPTTVKNRNSKKFNKW